MVEPSHIEALAALRAVSFAIDMGFREFWLEGDALGIVQSIKCIDTDFSPVGHIIEEIKAQLNPLSWWKASHVRREGNSAAHGLAKFACNVKDFSV